MLFYIKMEGGCEMDREFEREKIKNEGLGNGIKGHTGLSWLFCRNSCMAQLKSFEVSAEERAYLRELAVKVRELAELPVQEER